MHTHTNYSDGALSPQELIDLAIAKNIGTIAITDHNTIEGIKDALEKPLKVMPVRTSVNGDKSQKYIGKGGTVTINPDSGLLIQCNPTDVDYIRRIENAKI